MPAGPAPMIRDSQQVDVWITLCPSPYKRVLLLDICWLGRFRRGWAGTRPPLVSDSFGWRLEVVRPAAVPCPPRFQLVQTRFCRPFSMSFKLVSLDGVSLGTRMFVLDVFYSIPIVGHCTLALTSGTSYT